MVIPVTARTLRASRFIAIDESVYEFCKLFRESRNDGATKRIHLYTTKAYTNIHDLLSANMTCSGKNTNPFPMRDQAHARGGIPWPVRPRDHSPPAPRLIAF
jgi:hypothetical protein